MANVTMLDRKTNRWLKSVTKVNDVIVTATQRKWNWAKKISSYSIERWPRRMCEWFPDKSTRPPGRPMRRWRDELAKYYGKNKEWIEVARRSNDNDTNRLSWKRGLLLHIEMVLNE